jgi:hypothetical protein
MTLSSRKKQIHVGLLSIRKNGTCDIFTCPVTFSRILRSCLFIRCASVGMSGTVHVSSIIWDMFCGCGHSLMSHLRC